MSVLDHVRIAKPCSANWSEMEGDERARHCSLCKLKVYNLSQMTKTEAEAFVQQAEGRTCIRYYERADGKILTKDCPKGVALVRRKFAMAMTLAFAVLGSSAAALVSKGVSKEEFDEMKREARRHEPMKTVLDKIDPEPELVFVGTMIATPPPHPPAGP